MGLVTTTDAQTVLRLADGAVAADPVRNNVFSAIAVGVRQPDAAAWAAYPVGEPLVLVARSQLYSPVTFTAGWTNGRYAAVVDALAELEPEPVGIAGPAQTVEPVALALGTDVTERMDQRLFRLDTLIEPSSVPGSARAAGPDDVDLLADWYRDFTTEAFGRLPPGFDAHKMVQRGVAHSTCWLWSDEAGALRSFAVRHPAMCGVARIGPVYTPLAHRGHGFGSAATAAATRDILAEHAVPCLYTDLANPTSNHIYQALGFTPVLDRTMLRFD